MISDSSEQLSFDEVFKLIRESQRELSVFSQSLSEESLAARVKRLKGVAEDIGSRDVRRPPPLERYLLQWNEYVSGTRNHMEPAAARYLCWEQDISTDYGFVAYLERFPSVLGARPLVGLVRSCHKKWGSLSPEVMRKVKGFIVQYDGHNKVLAKWGREPNVIIGDGGPRGLGAHLVTGRKTIDRIAAEWYLEPRSPFLQQVVATAAFVCRDSIGTPFSTQALFSDILPWNGWKAEDFKSEIEKLILHRGMQKIQEPLQSFVLGHKDLGDPRLPRNRKNWDSISREAVARMVEMLCREDIRFFFDHVYSTAEDKHKRKEFWLRYVGRCVAARPLLTATDKVRLKSILGQKVNYVGEIRSTTNSAFMLDFGEITAVEFSKIGACYIYESAAFKKVVPDFWGSHGFTEADLKDKRLCLARTRHLNTYNIDWRNEVKNILAQAGIRPGSTI